MDETGPTETMPKEVKPTPVTIEGQKVPLRVEIVPEQEQRLIAGIGKEFRTALEEQTEEITAALGEQTRHFSGALNVEISRITQGIGQLNSFVKANLEDLKNQARGDELPSEKLAEQLERNSKAIEKFEDAQRVQNELLEAQTPEALRIPTPQRLTEQRIQDEAIRLQEEGATKDELVKQLRGITAQSVYGENPYRSKLYHQEVEGWFEERLRYMETFETSFEEQPETYQRLVVAETFLRFREETKPLAEKLHTRIEARRLKQRMVRVWGLSTPDNLIGEASRFTKDVMKEIFTHTVTGEDGEQYTPIAGEFKEFEKKGVQLKSLRDRKRRMEKHGKPRDDIEKIKSQIDDKKAEITDYFKHGGYTKDAAGNRAYTDDEVRKLEERRSAGERLSSADSKRLDSLGQNLWARKSAGGLWSITFRAGHFGAQLNGTSDYFNYRIMNFADMLQSKALARKTKGVWNPKAGKYKDNPLDLGLTDFFSSSIKKGVAKVNGRIESLENVDLGDSQFWEDLEIPDQQYAADQIDKFMKADATRKLFWSTNSYFHNPDHLKFLQLSRGFEHIPEEQRQDKFKEMLERTLEWMVHDKDSKEVLEELTVFPAAEKMAWIEEASQEEMITNKDRDELLKEYLDFALWPGGPRNKAQALVALDTIWGIVGRYPPLRSQVTLGTLWELIKKGFGYAFSDELRR